MQMGEIEQQNYVLEFHSFVKEVSNFFVELDKSFQILKE